MKYGLTIFVAKSMEVAPNENTAHVRKTNEV